MKVIETAGIHPRVTPQEQLDYLKNDPGAVEWGVKFPEKMAEDVARLEALIKPKVEAKEKVEAKVEPKNEGKK